MRGVSVSGIFCAFVFVSSSVVASETGALFLTAEVGARASGMGSAYSALADDASAVYWNPAGLGQVSSRQMALMHSDWLAGSRLSALAYAHPMERGVAAVSLTHLSYGVSEGRNAGRRREAEVESRDAVAAISGSRQLGRTTHGGLTLKLLEQRIGDHRAAGFAADAGLMFRSGRAPASLAFTVQNVGPRMTFERERYQLPLTVGAGMGFRAGAARLAVDAKRRVYDQRTDVSAGAEWSFGPMDLRTGYSLRSSEKASGSGFDHGMAGLTGVRMGLGLALKNQRVDYSVAPFGPFGLIHRVSLTVSF